MKKSATLIAAIACSLAANAQAVYGYGATIAAGTYEEITDGTVLVKGTDQSVATVYDDAGDIIASMASKTIYPSGVKGTYTDDEGNEITSFDEAGYPIGFDFMLAGKQFTSFAVGTNGIVYLGNETVACTPEDGRFSYVRSNDNFVSCLPWNDVIALDNTEISYKLTGEMPNRTLVVQYKNWACKTSMWTADSQPLDMQIRLNETSNNIEIVFANSAAFSSAINSRTGIKSGEAVTLSGNVGEFSLENSTPKRSN